MEVTYASFHENVTSASFPLNFALSLQSLVSPHVEDLQKKVISRIQWSIHRSQVCLGSVSGKVATGCVSLQHPKLDPMADPVALVAQAAASSDARGIPHMVQVAAVEYCG